MKEKLVKHKKLIGIYIIWLTVHLIFLITSKSWRLEGYTEYSYQYAEQFWPLGTNKLSATYDISEFIIYSIVPVALIIAINFIFPKNKE
jgi:hypothetical protein